MSFCAKRSGVAESTPLMSFCAERSGVAESTIFYGPCDYAQGDGEVLWTLRLRAG